MLPAIPFVDLPRKSWTHDSQEKKPRLHLPEIEEKNLTMYSQEKFNRDFLEKLQKQKEKEALKSNTDKLITKLKKKNTNSRPGTKSSRRNARTSLYGIDSMAYGNHTFQEISRPNTADEETKKTNEIEIFQKKPTETQPKEVTLLPFTLTLEDGQLEEEISPEMARTNKLHTDLLLLPPKHRNKNDPYFHFLRKQNLESLYLKIIEGDNVNDELLMTRLNSHTNKMNFFGRKKKKFLEAILYETKIYKENIDKNKEVSDEDSENFDLLEHLAKLLPSETPGGGATEDAQEPGKPPPPSHLDELRNYLKYGRPDKRQEDSDEESVYSDTDIYTDPYYGLPEEEYKRLHQELKARREEEAKEQERLRNFELLPTPSESAKSDKPQATRRKKKEYSYNNNASLVSNLFRYTVSKMDKVKTHLSNINEIKRELKRTWRHTWNWRARMRERRMNPLLKSIYKGILKDSEQKKKEYIENMLRFADQSQRAIEKELQKRRKVQEYEEKLRQKDISKSLLSPIDAEELRRRNLEAKKNLFYTNTLYDWKKERMAAGDEHHLPKINQLDIDKYPDLTTSLEDKMKEKWKRSLELQKDYLLKEEETYQQDKQLSLEMETLMARYGTIDLSDRLTYDKLKNMSYYDEKDLLVREIMGFNTGNYHNTAMGGELDTIIEKIDSIQNIFEEHNRHKRLSSQIGSSIAGSGLTGSTLVPRINRRDSFKPLSSPSKALSRQHSLSQDGDWDTQFQASETSVRRRQKKNEKPMIEASKQVDKLLSISKNDIKKLKMKHSSYLMNDLSTNRELDLDGMEDLGSTVQDSIYYPHPHGSTLFLVLRSDLSELKSTSLLAKLRKHKHQRQKNKNLYDDEDDEYVGDADDEGDDFEETDGFDSLHLTDKKVQSPFDFDFRNPQKFHHIPHAYSSDEDEDEAEENQTLAKKRSSRAKKGKSFTRKKFLDFHKVLREMTRIKASNIFEIGALALGIEIADLGSSKGSSSSAEPPLDLSSLHTLSFNRGCMGNRGFIQIIQGIKYASLTTLRVLDLRHNFLTAVSLYAMLELAKLDLFPLLEIVLLSENEGKDEMTEAVTQWMLSGSMMHSMRELHLQNNSITDIGFSRIVKVLLAVGAEQCPKLTRLALEKNPISAQIKRELAPLPSAITV